MATATITQYSEMRTDRQGNLVGPREPNLGSEQVTYTTTTQSAALDSRTLFVDIATEGTKAHYAVGTNPTATAESAHIPTNSIKRIAVDQVVGTLKIALYDGTSV